MKFLIQKIDNEIRHDFSFHLIQSIHFHKWLDPKSKIIVKYLNYPEDIPEPNDIYPILFKPHHKEYIPIGSVEFVTEFLHYFYGVIPEPINIPSELSSYDNTRRGVWIGSYNALWSFKDGKYFIKSVTGIKKYANLVTKTGDNFDVEIPVDVYQISEYINIESEWRAFVYEGKLVGLQNYAGEFTLFPNPEVIKDMIKAYKSAPIAYTLDVGVRRIGDFHKETFVIECHDFFSCGLYGFADYGKLPHMFSRWFKEYLNQNLK